MMDARKRLAFGALFPYDHDFYPDGDEAHEAPPKAATDWAHAAARGIMSELLDRRVIKNAFEDLSIGLRQEIVGKIAAIIREAKASPE